MDSNKPSALPTKEEPLLTQNKIPSEMLASYQPQSDFEPMTNSFQQMSFDSNQNMMSQYNPYYQYQTSYFDSFTDPNTPFSTKFPRASDYLNHEAVTEVFPHLEKVNSPDFDIESISPNAQFYIMRSGNDDNIHKAIKYHIWSTTPIGKNVLRQAWQEFEENGLTPEIYLVFSVVSSNQFLGVAKMTSNVNDQETFKYWWEPCKWFGTIQVEWLFIKDIHHSNFEHITEGEYSAPVVYSRDSTPISAESGKMILQTFKEHHPKPNILDSFEYMDRREDYIRAQRDHNEEFEKFFEECCEYYKSDPDGYQPQKKSYYNKKSSKKGSNYNYNKKFNNNNNNAGNNNNNYKNKGSNYYKKSNNGNAGATNGSNNNNNKPQANKLEEQFVIKTEAKLVKKVYDNKKNGDYHGENVAHH